MNVHKSALYSLLLLICKVLKCRLKINQETRLSYQLHSDTDDRSNWPNYWLKIGQPWRTEPEIDVDRQQYLAQRRSIEPNIKQGLYPFKDINLSRADVEWLLATHENGRGPIDWSDESQREREGLDLRGANLRKVDLHGLPLARMRGGLTWITETPKWFESTADQRDIARIHLEGANLSGTHLEGANLVKAYLQEAYLIGAHLEGANLSGAHLEETYLLEAHFEGANLTWLYLRRANLRGAHLDRANIRGAFLDTATNIEDMTLNFISLADVRWEGVNLAAIDWLEVKKLGDEIEARQAKTPNGKKKNSNVRLVEYKTAVRANRQLSATLRDQGLNEEADHFAYRAHLLQRVVWRKERRPLKYVLSYFLYLLAGYGYRPIRSVVIYLLVILGFAIIFLGFGHISVLEAFVLSLTSFHGRGFFQGSNITLSDPRVVLAAFEAVVGLLIEISFIATFTQRFFGK